MLQILTVLVRAATQAFAGGLITDGLVTDAEIQTASGAVLVIATVVWSIIEKKYFTKK